jgi:hypothetical protein
VSLSRSAWAAVLALAMQVVLSYAARAGEGDSLEQAVRQILLRNYLHGVDDELAGRLIGPRGVPLLRRLLAERDFPRRDNVVGFLAHLDSGEAAADLVAFLARPVSPPERPEEDRALLIAPQALGRMARRGSGSALEALLAITAPGGEALLLNGGAAAGKNLSALRADLLDMSLRGLALSCAAPAIDRLADLASGRVSIGRGGRDLRRAAAQSEDLAREACGEARAGVGAPGAAPSGGVDAGPAIRADAGLDGAPASAAPAGFFDTHTLVHDAGLTYANHVNVLDPMTDAVLDGLMREASARAGRADFGEDVACCVSLSRSGAARPFGAPDDGLDIIDTSSELHTVFDDDVSRVKVVRAIFYCGGLVTNVIGCAYRRGNGIAVVRVAEDEAGLWIHEYGHNTGLSHNPDSRYIMHAEPGGGDNGLTQTECDTFHEPAEQARIDPVVTGACTDLDADLTQDGIDNCPAAANYDQADADADGLGDACDEDLDGDGVLNAPDNCPALTNPGQADFDADGQGDDCDLDDGLILFTAVGALDIAWQPEAIYTSFNLYRGDLDMLRSTALYTQDPAAVETAGRFCDLSGGPLSDPLEPPPGGAVFYLVTGVAGGRESSLGASSAGLPRANDFPCSSQPVAALHVLSTLDPVIDSSCAEVILLTGQLLDVNARPMAAEAVTMGIASSIPEGLAGLFNPLTAVTDGNGAYSVYFMLSFASCQTQCVGPTACSIVVRATAAGLDSNAVVIVDSL